VTLGLVAAGRFKGGEALPYIAAQVIGACAGAFLLYAIASGQPGWDLAAKGLAANGFGAASPGKYDLVSGFATEVVMTFFFLVIVLGATAARAPAGFAPIAIGLGLTLIHLISIPVTNTSVNPARSTGPAFVLGGVALQQLWLFWVAPILGGVLGGLLHRWLGAEEALDLADREAAARRAAASATEALAPMPAREPR